jgi:small nuclear ribonucleoprotein (snRNP)-like protein
MGLGPVPLFLCARRNYFNAALFIPKEVENPRRTKMTLLSRTLSRCVAMLLVCALPAPSIAYAAAKQLTPEQIHARVVKLSLGSWVGVRLQNGTAFSGKLVSDNSQGFLLQQYGAAEPTKVAYSDVFEVETGMPVAKTSRKPLTPEVVHARILKRGMGYWVGVQLENGVAFSGRIVSIDENSFGLQLYGDPNVTPVAYNDVVYLETGTPPAAFWVIGGVMAATAIVVPLVMVHEFNNHKLQMPTLPSQPVFPVY